jgi:hypothetical protein
VNGQQCGKNIIIPLNTTKTINGVIAVCSQSTETISLTGTATSNGGRNVPLTPVITLPAGTYIASETIVSSESNAIVTVAVNDTSNQRIAYMNQSFTLTETTSVYIGVNVSKDVSYDEIIKIQIEEGSTATEWTPYQGTSIPITFPTEAGTVYGGTLDVTTGVLTVTMVKLKASEVSSWAGVVALTDGTGNYAYKVNAFGGDDESALSVMSDSRKRKSDGASWEVMTYGDFIATKYLVVTVPLSVTTSAEAVSYFSNNDVEFVYELATPIEYDITPQQVQMLLGDNNVWCNTGDTTLTYYSDNTISQLLADLDSRADALESDVSNIENNYLPKAGGALTGDVTTSNTTFTSTSLVTKEYVDSHTAETIVDVNALPTGNNIDNVIYRLATTVGATTTYTYYAGDATNQTTTEIPDKEYVDDTVEEYSSAYWIGTRAEYNDLETPLADGTLVFITDDTLSYAGLSNKPSINSIILDGNKSASDLGLATPQDIADAIAAIVDYESEVFPNG